MHDKMPSILHASLLVALFGLASTAACGGSVSLADRPCPCAAGWTCCASDSVCVAPGMECPSDAGLPDQGAPEASAPDGGGSDGSAGDGSAASTGTFILAPTQGNPQCMTVDASYVYWASSGGPVVRAAKSDGHIDSSGSNFGAQPCGLTTNGSMLLIAAGERVQELALGGASGFGSELAPPIVTFSQASSIVADDTYFYATDLGSTTLRKCEIADPADNDACNGEVTLATGLAMPDSIVQDGSNVYWINRGTGEIMRAPKSGASAAAVIVAAPSSTQFADNPQSLAIFGTRLYWTSVSTLFAADTDGNNKVALVTDPTGLYASGVAANESNVYWDDVHGLRKISVQGGTPALVSNAGGRAVASLVVVDASRVYWTDESGNVWSAPN